MAYPFELPTLSYAYDALDPVIDKETMEIHHTKHHRAYVDKLNLALEKHPELQGKTLEGLLRTLDTLPESIRGQVRNHGGGHMNHTIFWSTLGANGGSPGEQTQQLLERNFGSFNEFKEAFEQVALGVFGSGWAWLATDKEKKLHIHGLPNQDNPLMHGDIPLLGIDVWEHAYYLRYQNRRQEYVKAWWSVVNWEEVERRIHHDMV
ncbi:MAG: superoxide dismutase [bacterium]|nr:superoxide dismutase [bacterium]